MKNRIWVKLCGAALVLIMTVACFASCSKAGDADYDSYLPEDSFNGEASDVGSTVPKGELVTDDTLADTGGSGNGEAAGDYQPKIIRKVTLNAETRDFNSAVTEVEASVARLGGYIESCNLRNQKDSYRGSTVTERNADYVIRIPADKLDAFLAEAGNLLNVTSTSSSAEDISGEYYDIQARLSVLETERQLLEKMLSEADSVDTMLTLEKRLYNVIYEIESYKTAIKVYDSKVAYSTVNLTLREVAELTDTAEEEKTFIERLGTAVAESWQGTVEFLGELLILSVYLAPLTIFSAICTVVNVVIIVIIVKTSKRKARRAREINAKKAAEEKSEG